MIQDKGTNTVGENGSGGGNETGYRSDSSESSFGVEEQPKRLPTSGLYTTQSDVFNNALKIIQKQQEKTISNKHDVVDLQAEYDEQFLNDTENDDEDTEYEQVIINFFTLINHLIY